MDGWIVGEMDGVGGGQVLGRPFSKQVFSFTFCFFFPPKDEAAENCNKKKCQRMERSI